MATFSALSFPSPSCFDTKTFLLWDFDSPASLSRAGLDAASDAGSGGGLGAGPEGAMGAGSGALSVVCLLLMVAVFSVGCDIRVYVAKYKKKGKN